MKGTLGWFVNNPVAANLFMILILVGGGITALTSLNKELFPTISQDAIDIVVPYPGAGPREVEEQICVRIEEAIQDLEGIKRIRSRANFGSGRVTVEVENDYDLQKMYNDIKTRVDAIPTFPVESERPQITQSIDRQRILRVAVSGEVNERNLKEFGQRVRDELAELHNVDIATLNAVRSDEVSIEVSEFDLRRYDLTFDDVVAAIRSSSINLPAGVIRSRAGDFQVQTRGQAYNQHDFEQIPLLTNTDGTRILLGDVARVIDGFADTNVYTRFDGSPAVFVDVYGGENSDVILTSEAVTAYVEKLQQELPPGLTVNVWSDLSFMFKGRMNLLASNALSGLALVFIILMLFLRPLLALWVAVGIGTAYMGAIWMLPFIGVSINMISMFAFLLILGIIVDDAIIVGESIYAQQHEGLKGKEAAVKGAEGVYKPVLFAVISTMVVFLPMLFLPGGASKFLWSIPAVVVCALTFSLIESFWILPSHLASMKPEKAPKFFLFKKFEQLRRRFADGLEHVAVSFYKPLIKRSLHWYPVTLAAFLMAFIFSIMLVGNGYVKQKFEDNPPMDWVVAELTFPEGYARDELMATVSHIEKSIPLMVKDDALVEKGYGDNFVLHNLTWVWQNQVWVVLELSHETALNLDPGFIANTWRTYIGELPHVEKFDLGYTANEGNSDIAFDLFAYDVATLGMAADEIVDILKVYNGVENVRDSLQSARDDIDIELKPNAETLGVSLASVAKQVRQGYYGEEAQRIPRLNEDVRVMVRYPDEERRSISQISDMRIRTPDRHEVPFEAVAQVKYVPGFTSIDRIDRRRSISVTADVVEDQANANEVVQEVLKNHKDRLEAKYPGLKVGMGGSGQDEQEFMQALVNAFGLSILIIYILMAVEFKSYLKPFGVLSAVPFGIMGSILGHWLTGYTMTIASFFGVLAAAGVVVNDNLVFIDRINQLRARGLEVKDALVRAGGDRFRPILLTSITTFIGLVPIMLDNSMQAAFLIPMVVSLAFGVLFATAVTLLFVPALYLFGSRLKDKVKSKLGQEDEADASGADTIGFVVESQDH